MRMFLSFVKKETSNYSNFKKFEQRQIMNFNENIFRMSILWMFHKRTINNKVDRLHERALRIVYKDEIDNNRSFKDLLDIDCAVSIHDRNLKRSAVEKIT